MLRSSNPMGLLYVICLKVRDFMVIRDEKHYLKRELEVWHVDKVYALVSYYPFLDLHVKLLNRI